MEKGKREGRNPMDRRKRDAECFVLFYLQDDGKEAGRNYSKEESREGEARKIEVTHRG